MAKPTIAFFELEPWEKKYIQKKLRNAKPIFIDGPLSDDNIRKAKAAQGIAVFIFSKVNKKVMGELKKLRLITTMSTGFDHIDLKEAKKKNIAVCNVPSYGSNTVAEHGFAMLLALSRKLFEARDAATKAKVNYPDIRGFDLRNKTIGILGTGKIGQHMIRMAKGFEMDVVAWDKFPNKSAAKELGFRYEKKIDAVLKKSDVLSLHLPLLPTTKHIINKKNIKKLKKGCIIINTARGGLIDTTALLDGLNKEIIGGAGIDVLEEECAIKEEKQLLHSMQDKKCDINLILKEHILMKMDNVIVTPHNAFNSVEALQRILNTTIENITCWIKKKPCNVVRLKK